LRSYLEVVSVGTGRHSAEAVAPGSFFASSGSTVLRRTPEAPIAPRDAMIGDRYPLR
jgi:hypothetical protein